jgi:hypothetical protein
MDQGPANRDVLDLFCSWLMVRFEFADPVAMESSGAMQPHRRTECQQGTTALKISQVRRCDRSG